MKQLGAAAVAILLSLPTMARAESAPAPPRCALDVLPAHGHAVPQNVPALILVRRDAPGLESIVGLSLVPAPTVTFEQRADPRQPGATLLIPSAPLLGATSYTLTTDVNCVGASASFQKSNAEVKFATVGTVPLPTTTGSAAAKLMGDKYRLTEIAITPSAELAAYLHVTRLEAYIGGQPWGAVRYGDLAIGSGVVRVEMGRHGLSLSSFGSTDRNLCAAGDTTARTEKVELRPHVAGAETDPEPIVVDVPIDCSAYDVWVNPGPSDAGPDDPGAANPSVVGDGSAAGCACTSTGGSAGSGLAWIVGAVVVGCVARLKRARAARR